MAELRVQGWNSLSESDKAKITEGLIKIGSVRPGSPLVDAGAAPSAANITAAWDPIGDLCRAACDVAAGAAAAWCTANTAGVATAVCFAAAAAAREECRKHC